MSPIIFRTAIVALMCGLVGCTTVGPDFRRPTAALPDRWSGSAIQISDGRNLGSPDARWWKVYNDAELSSLVERVAAANLDVKAATIRWTQARAARRMMGADAEPSVGASASYQHGAKVGSGVRGS